MTVTEFTQASSALAAIAMILIGSRRLKQYLRSLFTFCSLPLGE